MAQDPKQASNGVIYLEVDEDITAAVDKLSKSESEKVQLVTTKRSTLLQSVINLKLLQKAAKGSNKELIIVTTDRVATSLAGRLGIPVASQVGETAKVPSAMAAVAAADDEIDGGMVGEPTMNAATGMTTPLTAMAAEPPLPPSTPPSAPAMPSNTQVAAPKPKGQHVPSISGMQKRVLWGVAGVVGLGMIFGIFYYLASAKVTLFANASQVNTKFAFTADPAAKRSDIGNNLLSAQRLSLSKAVTASVEATGTKDLGSKARGSVIVSNSYDSNDHPLVSGTRFVASNGLVFRSTEDAVVPGGSLKSGKVVPGQVSVAVQADQNGDQYNLGPGKYTIPGLPADQQSGISGQGEQMSGGTTKTAKVVTQPDIAKAQAAALESDRPASAKELANKASDSQTVIDASLQQNVTSSDSNPAVNSEAQTATLTLQVTYSQLAVEKSDLSKLARTEESKQLGGQSQIYDDGSDKLEIALVAKPQSADSAQKFNAAATAFAGTKIDTAALAKELKGKKYGDALDIAQRVPGVDRAEISLKPGWFTRLPGISSHINITIKVANTSSSDR
ncbi:MAG TPA: hypothetical protein VF272_01375 [Candidatus Saccharimonadia bacterium]